MWNVARVACLVGLAWLASSGCSGARHGARAAKAPTSTPPEAPEPVAALPAGASLTEATVIELAALRADTARYEWFDFKPGVRKLILSGAPDSRHVSILWYGFEGKPGRVPLHYHAKTESIFVIDGTQSDVKDAYGKGSFYFNPPGSGHDIFDSAGLFLLSYAAPPDFKRTSEIGPYENVKIGADYSQLPLAACSDGSLCYTLPLVAEGGMRSRFVKPQSQPVLLSANVLLVLQGSCVVAGQTLAADTLSVTKSVEPASFPVADAGECLLYAMAFE